MHYDIIFNLVLALSSKIGEIADILAWRGNALPIEHRNKTRDKIAPELADVTILLMRFAVKCDYALITDIANYITT